MKFCTNCDNRVSRADHQCPHCGYTIDVDDKTPPNLGLGNDNNIIKSARNTKLGAKDRPIQSNKNILDYFPFGEKLILDTAR